MVRGERAVEMDKSEGKDLEPYYRLIEIAEADDRFDSTERTHGA